MTESSTSKLRLSRFKNIKVQSYGCAFMSYWDCIHITNTKNLYTIKYLPCDIILSTRIYIKFEYISYHDLLRELSNNFSEFKINPIHIFDNLTLNSILQMNYDILSLIPDLPINYVIKMKGKPWNYRNIARFNTTFTESNLDFFKDIAYYLFL